MSKNPANRTATDHIKEGLRNIPKTYDTLYNRPKGPGGGLQTVPQNLRVAATGKTGPGMPKQPAATRAKIVGMGAASVTPLGPVAAFASGVVNSVKSKNAAIAKAKAPKAPPAALKTAFKKPPVAPAMPAFKAATPSSAAPKPGGAKIGTKRT